jgi:nucleotide-binding universal stress UspA family protein
MAGIVVGIDGSEGSREALRFAAAEARLRNEHLRVVSAWHVPTALYAGAGSGFVAPVEEEDLSRATRQAVEAELAEVLGADADVDVIMREGNAAHVLIEESTDATLLVVGSRGHGGFTGLLIGSVGQQCAAHARCPVVIVHGSAG